MNKSGLVSLALQARGRAYAPYSHFSVGAALLGESGKIYLGCNIENAAYTPTVCAERTAVFKAVSEGERKFCALAVVGGPEGKPANDLCAPCGVCRQVLREFCGEDFPILLGSGDGSWREVTLGNLLPYGFTGDDLGG